MKTAIANIGTIISGSLTEPFLNADAIMMSDGGIVKVGTLTAEDEAACDVVVDAGGATVAPGFIDSHVHITFGDYTPRQKTVGFLESYLHGGTTTSITASEVHTPGRPSDREGVKALAVAAQRCFADFRPGGMRVYAGSVILEPGLKPEDMADLKAKGVWLAKVGFGAFADPLDYVPIVKAAREAGLLVTAHTGGASIPGSSPIIGDHILAIQPHVSFHINGGPVAMPDADFERIAEGSDIAMQVCTAGNLRTAILCAEMARKHDAMKRFLIATDTPTGSGIMPLGMLYTMINISSLTDFTPEAMIAASTGSVADVYGLNSGHIATGRDADLVILDAPLGGTQSTALAAMKHGDIPAIGGVFTAGIPRVVGRSRNTPPTIRKVRVMRNEVRADFGAAH